MTGSDNGGLQTPLRDSHKLFFQQQNAGIWIELPVSETFRITGCFFPRKKTTSMLWEEVECILV